MPHILGDHAQLVIHTAKHCHPSTHTPDQADNLLEALLHCIDLAGGITVASRPRAASPAKLAAANRTRDNDHQPPPMNPVQHHHGTGKSDKPPSDSDANYWRHEYQRVTDHHDRCEVIRRAANYLASLIQRDLHAPEGDLTDDAVNEMILINGAGWPPTDVARKYHRDVRDIIALRIDADQHPLTGRPWTPPELNVFAAAQAREMRDAGMNSTDIGRALQRSANTVRTWITRDRLAA